jgi:hypothetical protein
MTCHSTASLRRIRAGNGAPRPWQPVGADLAIVLGGTLMACCDVSVALVALALALVATDLLLRHASAHRPGRTEPGSSWHLLRQRWRAAADALHEQRASYIMLFRACLTVLTCIAILAVDFPIFPRRFAKAETYGVALMDVGPGAFVVSSGLMLGLRLQRAAVAATAHRDRAVAAPDVGMQALLARAARSVGPLAALGVSRLVLTKAVDYQARLFATMLHAGHLAKQVLTCRTLHKHSISAGHGGTGMW